MGWPGWGALLTRGAVGWPGSPLVPGGLTRLGGSMGWPGNRPGPGNRLVGNLHPERVDNTLEHSLGTKMEPILTFQWGASETAKVEHRLPLSQ